MLYRGTFDIQGNFNNDWTYMPGGTAYPVASVGGDFFESHLWTASRTSTTTIGTSCTNYMSVIVTPPANGSVFVDGDLIVRLNHTFGTSDFGYVYVGTTATDCTSSYFSEVVIPSEDPTTSVDRITVHVGEGFSVIGGTSYTFYLNGKMSTGADSSDDFMYGRMKAVFYPY